MRKKPTSRFRFRGDLFSKRIIITIPPLGALLVALTILVSVIADIQVRVMGWVSLLVSIIAVGVCAEARFQLRTFKYEMQEKITAQLTDWFVPDDLPDLRELWPEEGDDNTETTSLRLPKQG